MGTDRRRQWDRSAPVLLMGSFLTIVLIGAVTGRVLHTELLAARTLGALDRGIEHFAAPRRALGAEWEWLTDWGNLDRTGLLALAGATLVIAVSLRPVAGLRVVAAWAGAAAIALVTKWLVGSGGTASGEGSVLFHPFPSGHAVLGAAVAGIVTAELFLAGERRRPGPGSRFAVMLGALVALTGFGLALWIGGVRVWTSAHTVAEVVGGWLLGMAWVAAVVLVVPSHRATFTAGRRTLPAPPSGTPSSAPRRAVSR